MESFKAEKFKHNGWFPSYHLTFTSGTRNSIPHAYLFTLTFPGEKLMLMK